MARHTLARHAAPAALVSLTAIVGCALAGATALGETPVQTSQPRCGEVITADTTLTADLTDCPSNGIVIGADDITLDLGGHTIAGDGKPVRRCRRNTFCDVGVVSHGRAGLTVRNGSVRDFGTGVLIGQARRNRVLSTSSTNNQFFGFVVVASVRTVIRDSAGNANPAPDGDGIGVFGSRQIQVLNSSFERNELGMHVESSTDVTIEGNRFVRNLGPALIMEADRNRVQGNRCVRNGECIIVAPGSGNVVARNRIVGDGGGIAIEKGRGNLVAGNVIIGVRHTGIRLGIHRPPIGGSGNVVRGNLVRESGDDGFLVTKNDHGSRLVRNIAIGAGDDGFDVESGSARVRGNRALRNADLGIQAVPGTTDGGGNGARGNGDRRQCVYISCTRRFRGNTSTSG